MNKLIVLSLLVLLMCYSDTMQAQLPERMQLSEYIAELEQRTIQAVDFAGAGVKVNTIKAGAALALAIGCMSVAMTNDHDEMLKDLSKRQIENLNQLTDLLTQLEKNSNLSNLPTYCSELTASLEIAENLPVLHQASPDFLVPAGKDVSWLLTGKFTEILSDNPFLQPKISFYEEQTIEKGSGKKTHKTSTVTILPLEQNTDSMLFAIPVEYLPKADGLGYAVAKLEIPYEYKKGFKKRERTATYTVIMGLVPASPGSISLSYRTSSQTESTEQQRTKTYIQHATNGDLSETYCVPATEGLVTGSEKLVVEWSDGAKDRDWSFYRQNSAKGNCFVVETFYDSGGHSGKLNFHLVYDTKQQNTQSSSDSESAVLNWGEKRSFTIPSSADWNISFNSYNGKISTITKATQSSLVNVSVEGNSIKISTPTIEEFLD